MSECDEWVSAVEEQLRQMPSATDTKRIAGALERIASILEAVIDYRYDEPAIRTRKGS